MAEIRPIRALHYDLSAVPDLADVVAPPYDVIDAEGRAALLARSPLNVVEIDLPQDPEGGDPYEHAAKTMTEWTDQGILTADRDDAIWALEQDYSGPDGVRRTRRGFLCRVRVTDYGPGLVRPHERTQPGPKEDRLRLTRATRHNLSPIFSLHKGDVWQYIAPALSPEPLAEVRDAEDTVHRIWRIDNPDVHQSVAAALAETELLIADGHHRYETARTYADEIGGDGEHRYTLMALSSLDDDGTTTFGYHRMLTGLDTEEKQQSVGKAIRELFDIEEVTLDDLDPGEAPGIGVFGYIDAHHRTPYRITLKDISVMDPLLPDRSEAYRRLDAAILETLILRQALGMSEADVEAKKGLAYTASSKSAIEALDGKAQALFLMRPTPVDQVREVADAGETMPPKSTYFFPKLLTGFAFNPLS
ncbi:DUF1015 domain-containing protein [soil metagenome]